jgi:hypothetical protein
LQEEQQQPRQEEQLQRWQEEQQQLRTTQTTSEILTSSPDLRFLTHFTRVEMLSEAATLVACDKVVNPRGRFETEPSTLSSFTLC